MICGYGIIIWIFTIKTHMRKDVFLFLNQHDMGMLFPNGYMKIIVLMIKKMESSVVVYNF